MSKNNEQNKTAIKNFPSFAPRKSLSEVTADFVSKQRKARKSNGDNDYLQDFLTAAQMICENYKSFSFNDFLALTRNLDTPASALVPFFHAWVDAMKEAGRLKTLASCYDWPQHTFS